MTEKFDTVRNIRNPRFIDESSAYTPPQIQYISEKKDSSNSAFTVVIALVLFGVIGFQQYQILQMQQAQERLAVELSSVRNDLTDTNQKTDAAIEAIKRTQNMQRLCSFPVIGSTLCTIKALQDASTEEY